MTLIPGAEELARIPCLRGQILLCPIRFRGALFPYLG